MKLLRTRYRPATCARPARIVATDGDQNTITIGVSHLTTDPHHAAVKALCAKMDWHGTLLPVQVNAPTFDWVFAWVPLTAEGTLHPAHTLEV